MKKFLLLLGAGITLFVIFGTIYAVTQQAQRADANWPQIQLAEDTALSINQGTFPQPLSSTPVEIDKSLAPFTNIYDQSGKAVSGSGYLNGTVAVPPQGILTAADNKTYHTVTWQPQSGVRIAVVSIRVGDLYIVSGRSLVEVEKNMARTFMLSFVGGVTAFFMVLLTLWAYSLAKRKSAKRK